VIKISNHFLENILIIGHSVLTFGVLVSVSPASDEPQESLVE